MGVFSESHFISTALAPDADRYTGDPATDVYNMKLYDHITFIVHHGAGGTGTVVVTVEECTAAAGTGATAIPFRYRVGASTGVSLGALTSVAATGVTISATANQILVVEIDAAELSGDSPFVRLQLTEGVDSPVDASVTAILSKPSYSEAVMPDATV